MFRIAALATLLTGTAAAGDVEAGGQHFQRYCAVCHGADGKGDGPAGRGLQPRPRDFTDPAFWESRKPKDIKKVIKDGGPPNDLSPLMAAWGSILQDRGVDDVYAYVEATFKPSPPEAESTEEITR